MAKLIAGSIFSANTIYSQGRMMKKNCALVILFLFINCFLYSETFNVENYSYAFYIDLRGKEIVYRGFLYYRLDSNDSILFVRDIYVEKDNYEFSYFRILPGNETGIDFKNGIPDPFFSSVVDFVDFNEILRRTKNMAEIEKMVIYSQKEYWESSYKVYDDNSYEITLNRYLPFFKISSMRRQGDYKNLFILDKYGVIYPEELNKFYLIKPNLEENKAYQNQKQEEEVLHDIHITLDKRWRSFDKEGSAQKTRRDIYGASIHIEKNKKEDIGSRWDNIEQYIILHEMTRHC